MESVLSRLNDAIHQLNILALRQDELEERLDSIPRLTGLLARFEDEVRPFQQSEAGTQDEGEDLVGGL